MCTEVLTLRKVLNNRSGVAVHTGIVRGIVRAVVSFWYKIIRLRSTISRDESEENRQRDKRFYKETLNVIFLTFSLRVTKF